MGVDWADCDSCGNSFPDCGPNGWCVCEDHLCGWCLDKFIERYGSQKSDDYGTICCGCDACKLVSPCDFDLLAFALHKMGIDQDVLEDELRAAVTNGSYGTRRLSAARLNGTEFEEEEEE